MTDDKDEFVAAIGGVFDRHLPEIRQILDEGFRDMDLRFDQIFVHLKKMEEHMDRIEEHLDAMRKDLW